MAYFDKYGVEFSDDRKTLIKCPEDFSGTYIMPPNVQNIQSKAFYKCSKLKSIVIADSVKSFGEKVFTACVNLEHISVSPTNNVYDSRDNCNAIIETHTNSLIYGCKNTVIPSSIKKINDFAFALCWGLIRYKIPLGVSHVGVFAFAGCGRLISIELPKSLISIDDSAFFECKHLTSIIVPHGQEDRFSKMDGLRKYADVIQKTSIRISTGTQEAEIRQQLKILLKEAGLQAPPSPLPPPPDPEPQKERNLILVIIIIAILGCIMLFNAKCSKTRNNHYEHFEPEMEYRHS